MNLDAFINKAKAINPFSEVLWTETAWMISHGGFHGRAHRHRQRLWFTDRSSRSQHDDKLKVPFRPPWDDFAKATVTHYAANKGGGIGPILTLLEALREIEYAHRCRHGDKSSPSLLTPADFDIAQEAVAKHYKHGRAYRIGCKLAEISSIVDRYKIAPCAIRHHNGLRRPMDGDGIDAKSQEEGLAKMVSEDVLNALAAISANPTNDYERLIIRQIDLMVTLGFRVGEVLSLEVNCWITDFVPNANGGKVVRYGIRYWPEKGGEPIIKHVPRSASVVVRRAVRDLKRLCKPARQVAVWLEANPGRLPIFSGIAPDRLLSRAQVNKLLGFDGKGKSKAQFESEGMVFQKDNGCWAVKARHVEQLYSKRMLGHAVISLPTGRAIRLSECLSVLFVNQLHSRKATLSYLVRPFTQQNLSDALGAREESLGLQSIFTRHGSANSHQNLRARTHSFRHWLTTLLNDGGLSDVELSRWMGRRDLRQNEAYKHGTVAKKVSAMRDMIRKRSVSGDVASAFHAIVDPNEAERFLEARVQGVHFGPYGVCVHNYAAKPCEKHLNCLRSCTDYLRTKGSESERDELIKLRDFTARSNQAAVEASGEGAWGANSFVEHNRALLEGIDAALAVDSDPNIPDNDKVRVFQK